MAITAAKILRLLQKYGSDAVFVTYASEVYDPTTGKTTLGATTEHTHRVVEENRREKITGDADVVLYVSPSGMTFTPDVKMGVTYKGRSWTVIDVAPTVYKGDVVIYTLQLKGVG